MEINRLIEICEYAKETEIVIRNQEVWDDIIYYLKIASAQTLPNITVGTNYYITKTGYNLYYKALASVSAFSIRRH